VRLISGLIKAGIAKKVYDEARKPHNQAKIRAALQKATSSRRGGPGRTTR
jgi:hypothetical protein